jgi:hypothetical protein
MVSLMDYLKVALLDEKLVDKSVGWWEKQVAVYLVETTELKLVVRKVEMQEFL